jgi:imidazolonepropionase-like amidohydrolase
MEDKEAGKNPAFDMKLEAMIPVLKKEIPLKAHAHRADDIFSAIRIAREFDVDITLDHCTDGGTVADELAKEGLPAFVGPSLGSKTKIELINKSFTTPGILHAAGVKVSIITDSPVIPQQYLPMCAGLAVNSGLPYEEGWRAITINPAQSVGIGDRVGSLEPGKDGDVVIWSDDPLKVIGAAAHTTVVDGKVVYSA